ncbi:MAG TPA: HEAT repeat domain-containing protein, partial [Planctomycetota bacterium]|nr:HEAT repeat domain-containing protein [Planctomycetota bacterium]
DRKDVPHLLDELRSSEGWNRHFAKRELAARDRNAVSTALGSWIGALAPSDPRHEHHLLEALWLRETLDEVDESLLRRLLEAEEPRARAAAVRVVAHWREQLPSALELLARAVVDPFPRVRLEAVRALSEIADPRAAVVAAAALDQPMDSFLDYALGLTFRDLASVWVPALREGALDFGAPAKLDFALRAVGSQQVTGSIAKLIREDDLSPERRHALLVTLARAGGPEELDLVLDEALGARSGEDPSGTAALIAALEASGRSRGVFPAQKPAGLEKLFSAADEPVATGALRLAGAWRAATLRGPVAAIAVDRERAVDVRLAAIEALSEIGESGSRETLRELANESSDRSIRIHATASIARIDLELAARSSIDLLAKEKGLDVSDVEVVLGSFLGRKGGAARLESALEGATLPPDVAKLALRVVRDSGLDLEDLVAALRTAGRLPDAPEPTSAEERARILEAFADAGDPARGELVYRRDDLRCMQCHAIGGAGGRVGPDLSTIGASAQSDYILDSILDPPVAIKEGFHAAAVITQAGEVLTGVRVRRGDDGIVLRLSDDREVFVARSAIAAEEEAGSIMPAGLDHDMTRQELLDLLAFLTRLGKPGAYAVRSELTLRSWALLSKVPSSIAALSEKERIEAIRELSSSEWTRTSSMVSGDVPIPHADAPVWAQSSLDVSTPGRVDLEVDCGRAIRVWVDGRPLAPTSKEHEEVLSVSLERGRRTLLFEVAPGRESRLRVTIHTPPDGGAGVRPALHSSP